MLELLNTPEIHRIALIVGAIVAINYKNIYNITPGGVIVPGVFIVLFFISPIWCFTILLLSLLVYWLYDLFFKQVSHKGRTPMYVLSALSLGIAHPISIAYSQLGFMEPTLDSLSGSLIPAIIAFTCTRQKIVPVFRGLLVTTAITAAIVVMIYAMGTTFLGLDFDAIQQIVQGKRRLRIEFPLIQFYIILAVGYWFYRRAQIRSGGYIIAPAAAELLLQPVSATIFLIGCLSVYLTTKAICEASLSLGLNRYALALCLSTIFVWGSELIIMHIDSTILPFQGSSLLVIIAMLSYVNDGILYARNHVYVYMGMTIAIAILISVALELISWLLI